MSTDTHGAPSETENALHIEAQQHLQPSHPIAPDSDLPSDGKKDVASMGDEKTNSIPPFLHSPPESNNAPKSDGSDSELSDLEDEPMVDGASLSNLQPAAEETSPDALPQPEEIEDIGEVIPDHWSGAVPVFKPTMHQFKDFQHFVRQCSISHTIFEQANRLLDGQSRQLWDEVWHHQDYSPRRMEGRATTSR
jgi:hypothetical protein